MKNQGEKFIHLKWVYSLIGPLYIFIFIFHKVIFYWATYIYIYIYIYISMYNIKKNLYIYIYINILYINNNIHTYIHIKSVGCCPEMLGKKCLEKFGEKM